MGFRQDDRAISQILGTMTVIGIAVIIAILAGIMFHQVAQDKARAEAPPAVGMAQMDGRPEVRVVKVPTDIHLRWGEEIRTDGTCEPLLNGQAFSAGVGQQITAHDILSCDPGETLRIVYDTDDSGSILYRFEFD